MREDEGGAGGGGHGVVGAADVAPDDFVEEEVIGGVFFGKVHLAAGVATPGGFLVALIQAHVGGELQFKRAIATQLCVPCSAGGVSRLFIVALSLRREGWLESPGGRGTLRA